MVHGRLAGAIWCGVAVLGLGVTVQGNKYVDEQVERLYCGKSNCYELLGLEKGATDAQIKKAYRRVALALHPDRNPSPIAHGQMQRVNRAQEILTNKATKGAYDYYLDHPDDLLNLLYGIQAVYPARTSPVFALVLILGFISIAHWVHHYNTYHQQLKEVQMQPAWHEALNERVRRNLGDKEKSTGSKKRDQIKAACRDEMLREYIVAGNLRPWIHWTETWGWQALKAPLVITQYAIWYANWVWKYDMMGQDYSEEDKAYITRKFYDMSAAKWSAFPESEKEALLSTQVWDPACRQKIEDAREQEELDKSQSTAFKRMKRAQRKAPVPANFNDE